MTRERLRNNQRRGREAERLAERHLTARGHQLLARNLRVGRDEIDLVMLAPDRNTLVIVEVKSSRSGFPVAAQRLDQRKRHRVARVTRKLETLGLARGRPLRIDAVLVDAGPSPPALVHLTGRVLPPRDDG